MAGFTKALVLSFLVAWEMLSASSDTFFIAQGVKVFARGNADSMNAEDTVETSHEGADQNPVFEAKARDARAHSKAKGRSPKTGLGMVHRRGQSAQLHTDAFLAEFDNTYVEGLTTALTTATAIPSAVSARISALENDKTDLEGKLEAINAQLNPLLDLKRVHTELNTAHFVNNLESSRTYAPGMKIDRSSHAECSALSAPVSVDDATYETFLKCVEAAKIKAGEDSVPDDDIFVQYDRATKDCTYRRTNGWTTSLAANCLVVSSPASVCEGFDLGRVPKANRA